MPPRSIQGIIFLDTVLVFSASAILITVECWVVVNLITETEMESLSLGLTFDSTEGHRPSPSTLKVILAILTQNSMKFGLFEW